MRHTYLDIVNDDGGEKPHILLPDPSGKVGLGKLVGNLIHYQLKVLIRKYPAQHYLHTPGFPVHL